MPAIGLAARDGARKRFAVTQEQVVILVTLAALAAFSLTLDGFATVGNMVSLARNVAILGIMALAMGIVVIGRGLDLSVVAIMVASSGVVLEALNAGWGLAPALAAGLAVAVLIGLINGYVIAFLEVSPLFATLAMTFVISGSTRYLMGKLVAYPPADADAFLALGQGKVLGLPAPIIGFLVMALLVHLFLSRTVPGRFIYAFGDNADAARLAGVGTRPLILFMYMLSAAIAFVAGIALTASTAGLNLRYVESTAIFDVVLVVVLGGISLVGGRGGVLSVIAGTALIGTLLNGLTILDFSNLTQDIVKGLVLLGAIIIDNRLHPRDEETAKQGD